MVSPQETYDYDYMGRRFVKKVYSKENDVWSLAGEEHFVYDGYKQIAVYAGASRTLVRTYAWDAAGLDTPLWATDSTGSCFYVADANKNIRMLFDGNGTAVVEYDYDPFGQVTATGSYASVNPYRFSSEFHDDGTGLVYYNYRYYSPVLGRWISRDPINDLGSIILFAGDRKHNFEEEQNLFRFANNAPTVYIDRDGRIVIVLGAVAITASEATAIAAAIAAAACAGDINCRAAVADAINAVSEAVNTAIDRICRTRCRIGFHGPHHSFLMPRWGVPPWKLCWQKHIQMNCWQEGIRRSNFLEWRIQFGPCYKYRNAIPPVTH